MPDHHLRLTDDTGLIITFDESAKMKRTLILIILLSAIVSLSAHPWKPRHYVIVDTDGGIDDLKAICMLLSSPDVRLLAIIASDGYHKSNDAKNAVRKMADGLWHEGLPVAGRDEAITLIENVLSGESSPVTFIALGSLQTAADAITGAQSFAMKVKQIIWTNDGLPGKEGFNYRAAPAAAMKVLEGQIPVLVARGGVTGFYDDHLLEKIRTIETPYAGKVNEIISSNSGHSFVYNAYDEIAPLLLHFQSNFTIISQTDHGNKLCVPSDTGALRKGAVAILSGETVRRMQVIKAMPPDTSFYTSDLQPFAGEIRKKYGEDEWTSAIIANELHRHLGVFAVIGVKMGIRAREYFCTGVDEMNVRSHAGFTPPLSCMNDGIQVSTGATPGHGLLTVSSDPPLAPAAEFTCKNRTIRITLKSELAEKVSSELKEINFVYGLDSDIYWELVRQNSIKYWLQFDRHEIFDIEEVR